MPPRSRSSRPPPPKGPKHGRSVALDAGPIDAALSGIVPDARDRAFVLRCVLEEGPRHHRVASWALLRMLAVVLAELGGPDPTTGSGPSEPLGMRLPPNVVSSSDDTSFPIGIPTGMIRAFFDESEAALALECLSDGPPHHLLANATMAWMLEAIYERAKSHPPPSRPGHTRKAREG